MRVVKHRQWTKYIDNNDNQNIQTNNEEKIIKPFDTFKNISMKNDQVINDNDMEIEEGLFEFAHNKIDANRLYIDK
ncbi:hypothetical protein RclHR1_05070005 [Rhizophagus clarus]|uniref:Uncharacterized protein n=1 Tax=Rhizophagus clarus TaxID=94130 RepID=A0A2Z6RMB4_9GLOM|nr:hypothetical protein RclHR1_05070005 [Rhizophagus clarus]